MIKIGFFPTQQQQKLLRNWLADDDNDYVEAFLCAFEGYAFLILLSDKTGLTILKKNQMNLK